LAQREDAPDDWSPQRRFGASRTLERTQGVVHAELCAHAQARRDAQGEAEQIAQKCDRGRRHWRPTQPKVRRTGVADQDTMLAAELRYSLAALRVCPRC